MILNIEPSTAEPICKGDGIFGQFCFGNFDRCCDDRTNWIIRHEVGKKVLLSTDRRNMQS